MSIYSLEVEEWKDNKKKSGNGCDITKHTLFNPLPNNNFLDWSKLKAFADDKLKVTEKLKMVLGRVENIVRKGENAGYQHFLLFPQCFLKAFFSRSLKVGIVW